MENETSSMPLPVVYPVVPMETEQEAEPLHPHLPNINTGALILIIGKIKAGKGVLISNLLLNDTMFADRFANVIVISPTIQVDQTSRFLFQKYQDSCFTEYNDGIVDAVKENQLKKLKNGENTSYCVVVDDMHGRFSKTGKRGRALINFSTRFRHYSIRNKYPCALILSTQRCKDVDPAMRVIATNVFISSSIKSSKEIADIAEMYADAYGGMANFMTLWDQCRQVPYSFLHLYLDRTPVEAYITMERKIYPNGKEVLVEEPLTKVSADDGVEDGHTVV